MFKESVLREAFNQISRDPRLENPKKSRGDAYRRLVTKHNKNWGLGFQFSLSVDPQMEQYTGWFLSVEIQGPQQNIITGQPIYLGCDHNASYEEVRAVVSQVVDLLF